MLRINQLFLFTTKHRIHPSNASSFTTTTLANTNDIPSATENPENQDHDLGFKSTSQENDAPKQDVARIVRQPNKIFQKRRYFIDEMRVHVKGGKGGDGCISFLREACVPKGPPSGGNGGQGGDIVFMANPGMNSLRGVKAKYVAKSGANGQGTMMHGKNAPTLVVQVPIGTVISEYIPPPEPTSASQSDKPQGDQEDILVRLEKKSIDVPPPSTFPPLQTKKSGHRSRTDPRAMSEVEPLNFEELAFDTPGQSHTIVKGGMGGFGNIKFSSTHYSPRERSLGLNGQSRILNLELRTIADIGLVGMPNAGKSSLLNVVSNASSKVAAYPFTTLNPYLGTLVYDDMYRITMADIPGLVAGAHRNIGVGHAFLKHIVRSRVLVFVVDLAANPVHALDTLCYELEMYCPKITNRPALIVGNKADLVPSAPIGLANVQRWLVQRASNINNHFNMTPWEVVPLSAKYNANVPALMAKLRLLVEQLGPRLK